MQWIPPASPRCARPLDVLQFRQDCPRNCEPEASSLEAHEKLPEMPVVAVINRKGGSGKSTLATHLAGYYANAGAAVMLGDVDRQLSTQTWLRQRKTRQLGNAKEIVGWSIDAKSFVRPPAGIEHVIVDTPGGLRGFDLVRVVMYADAILIPVCNSIFDRESATECLAELRGLPRVATGRCKLAIVGMRLDARTKSAEVLQAWAASLSVPFITVLRESQVYVRSIEKGLSVFDLPISQAQTDIAQWKPIVDWLHPIMQPAQRTADDVQRTPARISAITAPPSMAPRHESPRGEAPEPISPVRQHAPSSPPKTAVAVSHIAPFARRAAHSTIPATYAVVAVQQRGGLARQSRRPYNGPPLRMAIARTDCLPRRGRCHRQLLVRANPISFGPSSNITRNGRQNMQSQYQSNRRQILKAAAGAGLTTLAGSALAQAFEFKPNQRYPDPSVQVLDPSFTKYRIYSSTVEQVATGMRWAEGPVYFPGAAAGAPGYVLVSDIPNNRIMKFDEKSGQIHCLPLPMRITPTAIHAIARAVSSPASTR